MGVQGGEMSTWWWQVKMPDGGTDHTPALLSGAPLRLFSWTGESSWNTINHSPAGTRQASPAGGLTRRANSVSKKARPPPLSPIVPSWKCFHIWSSLTWIYPSDLTLEDTSSRKPFLTVSPTPTHQVCPPTFPLQPIPLLWTETFFLNTCLRYWPVRFKRTAGSHPVCFQQPQCLGTHPGSSERRKRDCRGGFLSSFSSRLYRH